MIFQFTKKDVKSFLSPPKCFHPITLCSPSRSGTGISGMPPKNEAAVVEVKASNLVEVGRGLFAREQGAVGAIGGD